MRINKFLAAIVASSMVMTSLSTAAGAQDGFVYEDEVSVASVSSMAYASAKLSAPAVKLSSTTASAVKLKWNKVNGADAYRIYKYDSASKKYVKVKDVKTTSSTISGLSANTTYKFAVAALVKSGSSYKAQTRSAAISAKTASPAPKLSVSSTEPNSVSLKWNKVAGAVSYRVFKYDKKTGKFVKYADTKDAKLTVTDLNPSTEYQFKVAAITKVDGKSKVQKASSAVSATTKSAPIVFYGHGDDVVSDVDVPAGLYKVICSSYADCYFSVISYDQNGDYQELHANVSDIYTGETLYRDGGTTATEDWSFVVQSEGDWAVSIVPIEGDITSNIKGHGDVVTGFFTGDKFCTIKITHTGDDYFGMQLYDNTGDYLELLANTSDDYSGKTTYKLESGKKYFLVVMSEETDWSVDFGIDDTLTIVKPQSISAQSGGSTVTEDTEDTKPAEPETKPETKPDTSETTGKKAWTASDVYTISEYIIQYVSPAAQNAVDNANKYFNTNYSFYLTYAVSYYKNAANNLYELYNYVNARKDLKMTDGSTFAEYIYEIYETAKAASEYKENGESEYALLGYGLTLASQMINLLDITSDLIDSVS